MAVNPAHSDTISLSPGDTLDGYTIGPRIGEGGTSVVWEAVHDESDAHVAIKQLLFAGNTEDDLVARRFRKEAKLLDELSQLHPRIVKVIDFIDDQRGAFLVMERIDGQSLEALLNASGDPIDPLRALKMVHAVANVLVAVHGRGIVHRDLKPSNLLLPEGGGVKVCDLGLASFIAEQEALPVGSVRYMAPELFTGEPVTGKVDIYALGMVAYEMFAGRAAFNDVFKTVLRDQRNQAVRWMKWHTNPRAIVPPLNELNQRIPPRLSDLITRMMDKDTDRRVASAQELAEAIARHFNKHRPPDRTGGPTVRTAPPAAPNAVEKTAELKKKRKWPMYVALVVLIIGSGAGGYFILDQQAKERDAREVVVQTVTGLIADGNDHYQQGAFAEASTAFTQAAQEDVSRIDADLRNQIEAGVLLAGARVDMEAAALDDARKKLEELDRRFGGKTHARDTIFALVQEVDRRQNLTEDLAGIAALIDDGRLDEARKRIDAYRGQALRDEETAELGALSMLIRAGRGQAFADGALVAAQQLADAGKWDQAITSLHTAMEQHSTPAMRDRLTQYETQRELTDLRRRAEAAEQGGDLSAAIALYQSLMERAPGDATQTKLNDLRSRQALDEGKRLMEKGDKPGAEAAFVAALGYADNAEAKGWLTRLESEADRRALLNAGDQAYGEEDYDAAVRHYNAALQVSDDADVRGKLTRARVQQELAKAEQAFAAGDLARAKTAFNDALALDPAAPGAAEGLTAIDTRQRYLEELAAGDQQRSEGRFGMARKAYTRAQAIEDTAVVRDRLDETEYEQLVNQARAYIELEQWTAARASLVNAYRVRKTEEVKQLLDQVARDAPREDAP